MDASGGRSCGGSCFQNVRAFLQYVQGRPDGDRQVPPAIVGDLLEMERRAQRVRAMTGVMASVELGPRVTELLRASGSARPGVVGGVINGVGA
jgi:hypothetical protein